MSFSETLVTSLHLSSEYLENIFSKIVRFIQSNKIILYRGTGSPGQDPAHQAGTCIARVGPG